MTRTSEPVPDAGKVGTGVAATGIEANVDDATGQFVVTDLHFVYANGKPRAFMPGLSEVVSLNGKVLLTWDNVVC